MQPRHRHWDAVPDLESTPGEDGINGVKPTKENMATTVM